MVEHRIIPSEEELSVQVYDAPACGWRPLYVERDGKIGRYLHRDHALTGIEIYDRADKATLFAVELEVYLEAARTEKTLDNCGLHAFVRFDDPGHHPYASFILPEDFIEQSELKIIGLRGEERVYSAGWK